MIFLLSARLVFVYIAYKILILLVSFYVIFGRPLNKRLVQRQASSHRESIFLMRQESMMVPELVSRSVPCPAKNTNACRAGHEGNTVPLSSVQQSRALWCLRVEFAWQTFMAWDLQSFHRNLALREGGRTNQRVLEAVGHLRHQSSCRTGPQQSRVLCLSVEFRWQTFVAWDVQSFPNMAQQCPQEECKDKSRTLGSKFWHVFFGWSLRKPSKLWGV